MEQSITELGSYVSGVFGEMLVGLLRDGKDISLLSGELESYLKKVGARAITNLLELADNVVRESKERKKNWEIHKSKCETTLLTIHGESTYRRTYYRSKDDKKSFAFLSDLILGIGPKDRTDSLLDARLIEEASVRGYRESGEKASPVLPLSAEMVLHKIRGLEEIPNSPTDKDHEKKRSIRVLYIEADEDHVALQRGGCLQPRLVCVHEGRKPVGSVIDFEKRTERYELIGKKVFSGVYPDSDDLWEEVATYLESTYELRDIQKLFLSGDGAGWIRKGVEWIDKSVYVVDKFHLTKYVTQLAGHVKKGTSFVWDCIKDLDQSAFQIFVESILSLPESEGKEETIKKAARYIHNVWGTLKYHRDPDYTGCSAEGHVSHILSARLSSRPLGWSKQGVHQMARLRAYRENGGDIHQLILGKKAEKREESKVLEIDVKVKNYKKAAGAELIHNLNAINTGKITGLGCVLKGIRGLV
jgi:hypothetical protein